MTKAQFIAKHSGGHLGDQSDYRQRLALFAGMAYDALHSIPELVTVDTTLTEVDSGKTYNIATDAKTFTLPLISADNLGMKFRFRNIGAAGAVALTLSPNALDGINGSVSASAGANADATTADGLVGVAGGVVNKNLVNTKASANAGDWIEIEAVAATKWFITGGVGIWASEG